MTLFQDNVSLRANSKVFVGSPPTGWEQPSFNDSSWTTPVAPTVGNPPPYGETLAPWTTPPTVHAGFFFRIHIFPDLTMQPYVLKFFGDASLNLMGEIFVNGQSIGFAAGYPAILTPPSGMFTSDTVIAGGYTSSATTATENWMSMLLRFYTPDPASQPFVWGTVTPGVNDKGFMGTGDTSTHLTPTPCDISVMPAQIVKVASNGKTTLFLTNDGRLYGCGDNTTGLLGTGSTDSSVHSSPQLINAAGGTWPVADMSIGDDCAIVLLRDGTVRFWGPNAHGSFGRGNTTASYSPTTLHTVDDWFTSIAAGKNFSALTEWFSGLITAGDNTYGQIGNGSSGGDVTLANLTTPLFFGSGVRPVRVAAGEDGLLIGVDNGNVWVCGRNEYGSLVSIVLLPGSGTHRIVSTPSNQQSWSPVPGGGLVQSGPSMSYLQGGIQIQWNGDGSPYGGNGNDGHTGSTGGSIQRDNAFDAFNTVNNISTVDFTYPTGMAYMSGGSQNSYATGDDRTVYAAIADKFTETGVVADFLHTSGKLYTWGYGGYGQMGSGADALANTLPVWQNGLHNVFAATVCAQAIFAISTDVIPTRHARSFAAVIGD